MEALSHDRPLSKTGSFLRGAMSQHIETRTATIYRIRHNYDNTHFMMVLDEKPSNLKICWLY